MISYDVVDLGAPLARIERPTPEPRGAQALIRTLAAGICHTDVHLWGGGFDLGGASKMTLAKMGVSLPFTLGHEIAGELVAAGPEAAGVALGENYLVYPWIGCGECPACRRGEEQLCIAPHWLGAQRPGGYSDHVLVPHARFLVPLGTLDPKEAAPYACAGLTVFGALRKLGDFIEREPIAVIGAGGLGLMCLTLLKAMGGKGAVVVDVDARKRKVALEAGALAAIDPAAANAPDLIREVASGQVLGVIDFVGARSTVQLGINVLANGGKLVVVGLFGGDIDVPIPQLILRAITIQGSLVGSLSELKELVALVTRAKPQSIPICCRPLMEVSNALEDLRSGKAVGRYVMVP